MIHRRKMAFRRLSSQALIKMARKDETQRLLVLEEIVARMRAMAREQARMKEITAVARWAGYHEACDLIQRHLDMMVLTNSGSLDQAIHMVKVVREEMKEAP